MNNCNISGSYGSGLCLTGGGTMTIKGETTIQNNCIHGSIDDYGLDCSDRNSSIHITGTIEKICKNNGGGGNYGGPGTFAIVNRQGQIVTDVSRNLNAVQRGRTKTRTSRKTPRVFHSPIQIRKDSPKSKDQVKQEKEKKEEEESQVDNLMESIQNALFQQTVELNTRINEWSKDRSKDSPDALKDKIDNFASKFDKTIKKYMRDKKYPKSFGLPDELEQKRSNCKEVQQLLKDEFERVAQEPEQSEIMRGKIANDEVNEELLTAYQKDETEKVKSLLQEQKKIRKANKLAKNKRFKKKFEQQQRKKEEKKNKVGIRLRM